MPKTNDIASKRPLGPAVEPPAKAAQSPALRQAGGLAAQEELLKPKDAKGGKGADPGLRGEMAILIIEAMSRGESAKDAVKQLPAEHRVQADLVLQTILKSEFLVKSWISRGVTRDTGGNPEVVKPAPAHVIAGWLGFLPKDPAFKPDAP